MAVRTDSARPNPAISLAHQTFSADGQPFLYDVPPSVISTPASSGNFIGFESPRADSFHAFPLGRLLDIRFTSIFRFKVWWTTQWTGSRGRELEHETQFLLLAPSETLARPYVLILPLVDGPFRASLRPGSDDFVEVCVESGSSKVKSSAFRSPLYMHSGNDPFVLVREASRVIKEHLNTFNLLEEKILPPIVDKFGWCTWDAFYLKVHPTGVWEGVKGLVRGGCPPGFVIIDDGWQSICHDEDDPGSEGMNRTSAGEQMPCRLIKFEENYKFRDYVSLKGNSSGMGAFVGDLKDRFKSVEDVYVWHALCGYWGGIRPGMRGMPEARLVKPVLSPGLKMTMEDLAVDKIVRNGVGLVLPKKALEMYEGMHGHLASIGISGVKVDVIHLLEMLCEDYGGRVELAKAYYKALSNSIQKHFHGHGAIASMEHCNDFLYLGTETISLGRVGDDFWCNDPAGDPNCLWLQGCHMVHCAFNSLWMGNFIHPDWDMFRTTHTCAEFHAASRAICGGPIYISDSVGEHNFELLKRLVLPDGTILRCKCLALPTRDCLFEDPLHDGKTMLKIWNLNKVPMMSIGYQYPLLCTGVLGAFNCQGGGWDRKARRNKSAAEFSNTVKAIARPRDIEWNDVKSPIKINPSNLFVVYSSKTRNASDLTLDEGIDVSLEPFDYELLTVSPMKYFSSENVDIQFAPIGLVNMLNTGGAVESLELTERGFEMHVKGWGEMLVYASSVPESCRVSGQDVDFAYEKNLVSIQVPWPGPLEFSIVEYVFVVA